MNLNINSKPEDVLKALIEGVSGYAAQEGVLLYINWMKHENRRQGSNVADLKEIRNSLKGFRIWDGN